MEKTLSRLSLAVVLVSSIGVSAAVKATSHEMSNATLTHYARALSTWMDIRQGCGEGAQFQGTQARVDAAIAAYQQAAGRLSSYTSGPVSGLSAGFAASARGAAGMLYRGGNSAQLTMRAKGTVGSIASMRAELERLIKNPGDRHPGPYQIALGNVNRALTLAREAYRVISCRRAEDEINFIVAQTVNAVPEESPIELPQTLGDRPFRIRGSECESLEEVSNHLPAILRDSNEALLRERAYYERAVASQMVVEYVRRHGGAQGQLDARRDERLRAMTNDLIRRFIEREERIAARQPSA